MWLPHETCPSCGEPNGKIKAQDAPPYLTILIVGHIVGPPLQEAPKIADMTRLEGRGPEAELAALREPLTDLNPQYFTLEHGFRR